MQRIEAIDLLVAIDPDQYHDPEPHAKALGLSVEDYRIAATRVWKSIPEKYRKLLWLMYDDGGCCEECLTYVYENYEKGDRWLLNNIDLFTWRTRTAVYQLAKLVDYEKQEISFDGLIHQANKFLEEMNDV